LMLQNIKAHSVEECAAASVKTQGAIVPQSAHARDEATIALLDIIQSGRDHPQERTALAAADVPPLSAAWVRSGAPQASVDAILHGKLAGLSAAMQCDAGIGMLKGTASTDPALAGRFMAFSMGAAQSMPRDGRRTAQSVLADVETLADIGPALQRLRAADPDAIQILLADMSARGPANAGTFMSALAALFVQKTAVIAAAPDGTLVTLARSEATALKSMLAADPAACFGPGSSVDLTHSSEAMGANTKFLVDSTDALTAGGAYPTERGPPNAADFAELRAGMAAAGLPPATIEAVLKGSPPTWTPAEKCAVGVAFYAGIGGTSPPAAGRLMANLIKSGTLFHALAPAPAPTPAS